MSASPTTPQAAAAAVAAPQVGLSARAEWAVLRWLLPLALLHGLLYLALVPPWQHYDEPTHFEYARMIAQDHRLSRVGEVNQSVRWQIADSMNRLDFWRGQPQPMLYWDVPFIGYDQRVHPPLYYMVAAMPIRAALDQPVEVQLYAARLVGVLLYALAVAAVWRMAVALVPNNPLAQLALPLIYACVPPFAAIMTSVNNDVLINFTGATLLLACVLLIRDGPRPAHLTLALLALVVGVMAKRTALMGLVPLALALIWAFVRRPLPRTRWLWYLLPAGLLLAPLVLRVDPTAPNFALGLRSWVVALDNAYLRLDIDRMVHSLSDVANSAPYYPQLLLMGFMSFWAAYGWGNVFMGVVWFWTMAAISVFALSGLLRWLLRDVPAMPLWQRRCYLMLGALALTGAVAMVLRLHPLPPYGDVLYIPRGRYLFNALPAVVALIALGLTALASHGRRNLVILALALLFLVVDSLGWALVLIGSYYGSAWPLVNLAAGKPGLLGFPPLYLALIGCYLYTLVGAARRLIAARQR